MKRLNGLIISIVTVGFVVIAALANAAPPPQLTSEQADSIERTAIETEQACLHNDAALQGVKNASVRALLQWLSEPRICACQAQMIRDVTTPEVFAMSAPEMRQFYFDVTLTKGADCIVPVMKEKFATSCEQLFFDMEDEKGWPESARKKLQEAGFADPHALVTSICACIKPAVQSVTTKDWMDSSKAAYDAYLERKRTGNNAIKNPPGPFDAAIAGCMSQLMKNKTEPMGESGNQSLSK